MKQYIVTGMTCAACSARVEKAVSKLDGVTDCNVSLLTNSMVVEGTTSPENIIQAVEHAGYHAYEKNSESIHKQNMSEEENQTEKELQILKMRLISSLVFLGILMYVSMGHLMFGFPIPDSIGHNPIAIALLECLLATVVLVINQKFFVRGTKALIQGAPNMDSLVSLGSGVSYLYSVFIFFQMSQVIVLEGVHAAEHFLHQFYFESAAMIVTLITVGKLLETRSKGKTTDALKSLMKMSPKTAILLQDGNEVEVAIEQVQRGNIFVVKPGEQIPVDGKILEGNSAVNEALLTGESIPQDKQIGDAVTAGTMNQSGYLKCEAIRVGEDTTLSQIIEMVRNASSTKAPIAKIADQVSGIFVPAVMLIAVFTMAIWWILGADFSHALTRGITVLVISCPCALGLATPVAIMVGNGVGAKNGILFKTAVSLEECGRTDIVVLDKTGTITHGEPVVTDVLSADGVLEEELLQLAVSLEKKSEHPLAKAILKYGKEHEIVALEVSDFKVVPGNGLEGRYKGSPVFGGNETFIKEQVEIPSEVIKEALKYAGEGKTPLYFVRDSVFLGMIAVADTMKEDSPKAIRELQEMGLRVIMLTGDNEKTAQAIGRVAGVDEVLAEVLPDGKERAVKSFMHEGKVVMVGDGMNDAPALSTANVGMAIGAGTDIAIDAADVVLVKSELRDVAAAIRLSRATLRIIHENLFWAFIYNIIGIPLAAGLFVPIFHWELHPMFGAAAMSLSSFCVVTNALRLNLFSLYDGRKDKRKKQKEVKEKKNMQITLEIEGMMCGHCEARVKKCLELLPEVEEAKVSYESGIAVISLKKPLEKEILKKTVEEQDYVVRNISVSE